MVPSGLLRLNEPCQLEKITSLYDLPLSTPVQGSAWTAVSIMQLLKRLPLLSQVFVQNYALFNELRAYPLIHLAGFSVQIFTVPTLTPRLVLEDDLLDILLATLRDVVRHAIGRTGRLEVSEPELSWYLVWLCLQVAKQA